MLAGIGRPAVLGGTVADDCQSGPTDAIGNSAASLGFCFRGPAYALGRWCGAALGLGRGGHWPPHPAAATA